jgi:hypothetical protein
LVEIRPRLSGMHFLPICRRKLTVNRYLEPIFAKYLDDLVRESKASLKVIYRSGLGASPHTFTSKLETSTALKCNEVEIHILSPAFFSRFIHYTHTSEAFDREALFNDEKNRTVLVSRPDLLPLLLSEDKFTVCEKSRDKRQTTLDRFRWAIHRRARCPPAPPAYLILRGSGQMQDIRSLGLSGLDRFVLANSTEDWQYRRGCMRLFLAQRFAFGFTEIIDAVDFILRSSLILFAASRVLGSSSAPKSLLRGAALDMIFQPLLLSLTHLWAELKGAP